jgi:hemoglobin-like flavoprotein
VQVRLVQTSFETLKPVAQKFVEDFYDKLLTDHPEMRPLFSTADMKNQVRGRCAGERRKLGTLGSAFCYLAPSIGRAPVIEY